MTKKRASFFDIDGTLIKSQIIFDFPRHLHKAGLFKEKHILNILKIIAEYELNIHTYRKAGTEILTIYAEALKNQKQSVIQTQSKIFTEHHIKKKYPYTDELIKLLKTHTTLIALTASPSEPVEALKKYLPFTRIYATELETKQGIYTGKIKHNLLEKNSKQKAQLKITKKLNIDLKNSLAFGDSDADIEYLALVGHPIALNPNYHLKATAKQNNWPIYTKKDPLMAEIKQILKNSPKHI